MLLTAQSPLAGLGHCEEITDFVGLGSFGGLIGAFWEPRINRAFHAYQVAYQRVRTWVCCYGRCYTHRYSGRFPWKHLGNSGLETALLLLTPLFTMHLLPAHLAVTMLVTSSLVTIEKMPDSMDTALDTRVATYGSSRFNPSNTSARRCSCAVLAAANALPAMS